jgi:hypothetical protein
MHRKLLIFVAAVLGAVLTLVSCGGTGDLAKDLGGATGGYVVVDLGSGTWETRVAIADLVSNPEYKDRYLVFKAVDAGSSVTGSMIGAFGAQSDEPRGSASTGRILVSVFELTQAQWTRIAGTSPWTVLSSTVTGTLAGDKPAMGVSFDDVELMLAAGGSAAFGFRLPSAGEWERCCRAGSSASFAWGEARDDVTVALSAVVTETAGSTIGPRVVGGRAANAFGFYDMHGNVWEFTADGDIRGGSWRDSLPSARSANLMMIDQISAHPLVGVRLVLEFR